ncbi:hypothetical protein HD806DRAFT_480231 [Xylariaceae sp. AK1471]|nr:hypothetical protein HD806DRAFT_480231 [Xylariaceae sp. AK1471]
MLLVCASTCTYGIILAKALQPYYSALPSDVFSAHQRQSWHSVINAKNLRTCHFELSAACCLHLCLRKEHLDLTRLQLSIHTILRARKTFHRYTFRRGPNCA